MINAPAGASVSVVTITHGDRWHLLVDMLKLVDSHPSVERIVLVDNGAHINLKPLIEGAGFGKVTIVRNERNLGSAAGFKRGLEAVRTFEPTWIWLLDDDNLPEPSALDTILAAAGELDERGQGKCAFLAFRPALQADIARGIDVRHCYPPHSSFCGFHLADIPLKVWRRLGRRFGRRPERALELPARVSLPYATFGGLFFHRKLLEKIGTPNEELVLYADDTDFSHRIVKSGGSIWLLTGARMSELESSWSSKTHAPTSFERWLQRGTDFQVFYGARNRAYFDCRSWLRSRTMYRINRFAYLALLRMFALKYHNLSRYKIFRDAVMQGERGRLGLSSDYPLL